MNQLIAALQARGHKVQTKSGSIDIIIRVSAEKSAYGQTKQPISNHSSDPIDVKKERAALSGVLLLKRDDAQLEDIQPVNQTFTTLKKYKS